MAVVALVAVALIGPGGGDESAVTPADPSAWAAVISSATPWACPSPSPKTPESARLPGASDKPPASSVVYPAASLPPEDLPEHFRFQYGEFTTNGRHIIDMKSLLKEPGSLRVTQEELDCWGRILGYTANYAKFEGMGRGTASLLVVVDLFRDSGGAGQYFAWLTRDLSDPEASATWKRAQDWGGSIGQEWQDVSASPMTFPPIGDERIAAVMAAAVHYDYDPNLDYKYAAKAVAFRSGRAVGTITITGEDSVPRTKELERLARTLDERMKDALE